MRLVATATSQWPKFVMERVFILLLNHLLFVQLAQSIGILFFILLSTMSLLYSLDPSSILRHHDRIQNLHNIFSFFGLLRIVFICLFDCFNLDATVFLHGLRLTKYVCLGWSRPSLFVFSGGYVNHVDRLSNIYS